MSLYQKLGGENAISAVVDKFYEYMLKDQRVNHFYQNSDMNKLRLRQKEFIAMVTGGPNYYKGSDMKVAHCKFKINEGDFDATWENLEESLIFFNVEKSLIQEVKEIFYSVKDDIITQKQKPIQNTLEIKQKDSNLSQISKCPFSGKSVTSVSQETPRTQGEQNCPYKLKNNPYKKPFY